MAYIGLVTYGSVAVLLLTMMPISLVRTEPTPTTPIPSDTDSSYSNALADIFRGFNVTNWMNTFQENNPSVAYKCVTENFPKFDILSLVPGNQTDNYYGLFVKAIMKKACSGYVKQILTCLEQRLSSGTTRMDMALYKLLDFPRLRFLTQYLCGKIDTIADNVACVQRSFLTKMKDPSTLDELKKCFIPTMTNLLSNGTKYNEETAREAFGGQVKYYMCIKPMLKGCGDFDAVYDHTLAEMYSMYKGEKIANSARPVTGQSSLMVTIVVVSTVLLRLGYW